MNMKFMPELNKIALFIVIAAVFFGGGISCSNTQCPESSCRILSNGEFDLRVRTNITYLVQYQYFFETRTQKGVWKTLYMHQQNEPLQDAYDRIVLLSDGIGFYYAGSNYGVTINNGNDWHLIDLQKNSVYGVANPEKVWIDKINMEKNGHGKIVLVGANTDPSIPIFSTNNYGVVWKEQQSPE